MSSFYTITTVPTCISPIPTSFAPSPSTTILLDSYLVYVDVLGNCLVVIDVWGKTGQSGVNNQDMHVEQAGQSRDRKNYWQIPIPANMPNLQNVTHLLTFPNHLENTLQKTSHSFILLTTSYICYIQLNSTLTKITSNIYYHLLHQPQQPGVILNQNTPSLYNQQVFFQNSVAEMGHKDDDECVLMVVGFDQNYRIVGNAYRIMQFKKCSNQNLISMLSNFRIEIPEALKNIYECSFTLTCPHPNTPLLYLYQVFNQKGLPLFVHQYDLQHLLHLKEPQTTTIKATQKYELFSLHNHYHISAVYQEGDDLYVCYVRYVPFNKNKSKEQTEALSNVWVYNLSQGYTRNIIDLKGFSTSSKIIEYRQNDVNIKSLCNVTYSQKQDLNRVNYVKMDSSAYHPKFEQNTRLEQYLYESEKHLITQVKQQKTHKPSYLSVYEKIKKKAIYCKMWQELKFLEGEAILEQIISML